MNRRLLWIIISCACVAVSVGITLAVIVASSHPVINTFTVGEIELDLNETTGDDYIICPGVPIEKDPVVTVHKDSVDCWLFVKVDKTSDFDTFMSYQIADGWQPLDGNSDVYYREVKKSSDDVSFNVLLDNTVTVYDTVTDKMLAGITVKPALDFKAYAVQSAGISSVDDAWQTISKEE